MLLCYFFSFTAVLSGVCLQYDTLYGVLFFPLLHHTENRKMSRIYFSIPIFLNNKMKCKNIFPSRRKNLDISDIFLHIIYNISKELDLMWVSRNRNVIQGNPLCENLPRNLWAVPEWGLKVWFYEDEPCHGSVIHGDMRAAV